MLIGDPCVEEHIGLAPPQELQRDVEVNLARDAVKPNPGVVQIISIVRQNTKLASGVDDWGGHTIATLTRANTDVNIALLKSVLNAPEHDLNVQVSSRAE